MNDQLTVKKLILFIVGLVTILASLQWLWHYLHTGNILITTNNSSNAITLTETSNENIGGAALQTFSAHGKLSVTVALGQYIVTVKDGTQAATQLINLSSHKTLRYQIDPVSTASADPVISQSAKDITASNNQLIYLDATTYTLNRIDVNNNLTTLNRSQQFQTVKWVNESYGVGQDSNQNLYVIDNGSVSTLITPISNSSATVNFDVAPDKQIYLSSGADIYMGSQNESFKKIYNAPSSNLVLGAAANKVAFGYTTSSGQMDRSEDDWIAIVNALGKVIKTDDVDEDVSKLVWSPNEAYLASVNESSINVYDSSLHRIASIPTSNPAGPAEWLGSNKLVYSEGSALWLYNLSSHRADLIANLPLDNYATSFAINNDGSYVYITTEDSTSASNSSILRIGLRGQQTPAFIYQLQDILPMTLNGCTISLVNFAQPPTIMVEPFPNSGLDSEIYIQEAQTELQQDGFDLSKLTFKLGQGS